MLCFVIFIVLFVSLVGKHRRLIPATVEFCLSDKLFDDLEYFAEKHREEVGEREEKKAFVDYPLM